MNHPPARDDEPAPERPTMHPLSKTIADDIRRRHNSATDPAFVAALDHVVTRWAGTLAKLAEGPTGAHNVGASYLDSRPTMDAGPIDNDGATTHPPKAAAPSLPSNPTTDEVSDATDLAFRPCSFDGLRSDGSGDVRRSGDRLAPQRAAEDRRAGATVAAVDHEGQPGAVSGRSEAPGVEEGDPRRAAGDASTLSPAPATSKSSASIATESGSLPLAFDAPPPAKPKRKAKAATTLDLDAWGRCCQAWDTIRGKPGAWKPEAGMGRQIAEGIGRAGAARMEARLASVAAGTSPAGRKIRAFFDAEGADLGMLCWERGAKLLTALDGEIEQATLDAESRSGGPQAVGGMLTHPSAQNAPERQTAPKQNGSAAWDDMLSVIRSTGGLRLSLGLRGSTLSHDAGEHKRRCQAVADIGGWAKFCELNDFNRMAIRAQWVSAYERAAVSA